jgi:hypothetical protein
MAEQTPHSDTDLLETAERRDRVLELREEGHDLRTIAARLEEEFGAVSLPSGWDSRYVAKDIQRALQKVRSEVDAKASDLLRMELRRLDALQAAFYSKALGGDAEAFDRVLKAMRRRAKYMGLDEPDELDVTGGFDHDLLETLLDALEDYPEARRAVAKTLDAPNADE